MVNVLVVGSVNMDVVTPMERLPNAGETIRSGDISLIPGGKGANAAVAAARLGGSVSIIGAVGNDAFGDILRKGLEDNHVNCTWLKTVQGSSGTAIILLDQESGQNSILVSGGANFQFELPDNITPFKQADVILLQQEIPMDITIAAANIGKKCGKIVVLDPAPAYSETPSELLKICDVISPNEVELEVMTGYSGKTLESARAGARVLLSRGVSAVAVKMGAAGGLWVDNNDEYFSPGCMIDPVDTTAAGDSFTGALALSLASDIPPKIALEEAIHAGALACLKRGAQPSLPTRKELSMFMKSGIKRR